QRMIPAERLFTVVSQSHLRHPDVARQLSSRPMATLVQQPDNRDTGPGLLLPLAHLYRRYPDSTVVVFPSDHFILEEDLFMAYVDQAFRVVEQDPAKVVLLGINPSEAEPEYGYIVPGKRLTGPSTPGTYEVSRFIEKPEREVARDLVSYGGLWNTLVMVFKAKTFLNAVSSIAPLLYGYFERIWRAVGTPSLARISHDGIILRAASAENTFTSMIRGGSALLSRRQTVNWTPMAAIRLCTSQCPIRRRCYSLVA